MRPTLRDRLLLGLLLFDGVTAVGGGLALMTGVIPEQDAWVRHTGFAGLYFPGLVLMAVVGGSAVVAAVAMAKRVDGWQLGEPAVRGGDGLLDRRRGRLDPGVPRAAGGLPGHRRAGGVLDAVRPGRRRPARDGPGDRTGHAAVTGDRRTRSEITAATTHSSAALNHATV